jgi:hypothetical protein
MCSVAHIASQLCKYNQSVTRFLVNEEHTMGTSLYNKIPLGRSSVLDRAPVSALVLLGVCLSIAVSWMALQLFK